jgi:hypothetical protein
MKNICAKLLVTLGALGGITFAMDMFVEGLVLQRPVGIIALGSVGLLVVCASIGFGWLLVKEVWSA